MRLNRTHVPLLLAVASLCGPSSALPFLWRRKPAAEALALAARPTYSVVPIDGSGGHGGGADTTLTVTVTSAPTTIIESPPPVTETVTVSGKPATRTISIIDIEPTTEVVTATVTRTLAPTLHTTTTSASTTSTSGASSMTPAPPSSTTSSVYYPTSMGSANVTTTPSVTASMPTSSWVTSQSHDDGSWHTTYPSWNSTLTYRFTKRL
ncbi:hypothetical protein SAMD00023353_0301490 [Rosellinia necatrix]|uniref:Uncharacterized protein n=1 Tax=Rosellinia necatrix TaxID=77044 RepID=A0A1W2TDH2_ROSNE|nr:hypothetical protein SAMD00023353_0301490 [Rosellinia necatrix]